MNIQTDGRTAWLFKDSKLSWRHPGAILWKSTYDHIFITESNFSFIFIMNKINIRPVNFRSINVRKFARARSSARLRARKIFKCSKSSQIFFTYVSGHMEHLIKKLRTRACARVFARTGILQHRIADFFLSSYLVHFSKHFDNLFTFY